MFRLAIFKGTLVLSATALAVTTFAISTLTTSVEAAPNQMPPTAPETLICQLGMPSSPFTGWRVTVDSQAPTRGSLELFVEGQSRLSNHEVKIRRQNHSSLFYQIEKYSIQSREGAIVDNQFFSLQAELEFSTSDLSKIISPKSDLGIGNSGDTLCTLVKRTRAKP